MKAPMTIYERNGWKVTSQGNGLFYVLSRDGASVLFQGDDALQFEQEVMDTAGCWRDSCEQRFADYSEVMQPDN